MPRIDPLTMNGDWGAWQRAGVAPQIITLPVPSFARFMPDDIWQTFRDGTAIGAVAHDDANLYFYFVVTDDQNRFDGDVPTKLTWFDAVELWVEEEQFAFGMTADGKPASWKWRHHNRAGKPFAAAYGMPADSIWATKLNDLSSHPLGRLLEANVSVSLAGKHGYAVEAKVPYNEVFLVGGIAGRTGNDILKMTGAPGEIVRIGLNFDGIIAKGREQDFKTGWPVGVMFADPTRSVPFALSK